MYDFMVLMGMLLMIPTGIIILLLPILIPLGFAIEIKEQIDEHK